MDSNELAIKAYLEELYRQTGGDTEVQVSMHDLGAAIGYNKAEAGSLAEQLMVQGLTELRTLAGGISITPEGLAALGVSTAEPQASESALQLSDGPVVDENDRRTVQLVTEEIKNALCDLKLEYPQLEELVLDLKTIEVQMLSPKPKIGVLREIFGSLQNTLESANAQKITALLKSITN